MTVADYRDEVKSLLNSIDSFKACVGFAERQDGAERLQRAWRRLAMLDQPKRLPQADKDRCQRFLAIAAAALNEWKTEVDSGASEADDANRCEPPAQAMIDTMRFCAAAKRHGFC
jgi:hypothetical protein